MGYQLNEKKDTPYDVDTIMPDINSHNHSISVGGATFKLSGVGIHSNRIKFRILQSHPCLREVISQNPQPGTEINPDQEVVLAINTWASENDQRFAFFASEETDGCEQIIDIDEIESWNALKSDVVHLYAALDQKAQLDGDALMTLYAHRLVKKLFFEDFKRKHASSGDTGFYDFDHFCSNTQIETIFNALKIRARRPFNSIDFKVLLCDYFKLTPDLVGYHQNGTCVSVLLRTHETWLDRLQGEWLTYLFCPLDMTMEFEWQPPPADSLSEQPNELEEIPTHPIEQRVSKWSFIVGISLRFVKWWWHWIAIILKKIAVGIWFVLCAMTRWLLLTFSLKQIVAGAIVVAVLFGVLHHHYRQLSEPIPTPTRPSLTHPPIQSIGGRPPLEAINNGMANAPYKANGTLYQPMSREKAKLYEKTGIASWYRPKERSLTVSGEIYDPEKLTAAHETLPIPSIVRVTNLENNRQKVLIVNDRGPFYNGRLINVSEAAARALGFHRDGKTKVFIEVIDPSTSKK